jgi:phage protein D
MKQDETGKQSKRNRKTIEKQLKSKTNKEREAQVSKSTRARETKPPGRTQNKEREAQVSKTKWTTGIPAMTPTTELNIVHDHAQARSSYEITRSLDHEITRSLDH